MSAHRSFGDVTLNEIFRGFARYRPFVLAVAAVVLVVVFLPGKPHAGGGSSLATGNFATGPGATGRTTTNGQAGANGGAGQSGAGTALASSGSFSGGPPLPGGATGSGTAASAGGPGVAAGGSSPAGGSTSALTPTADPACDATTGRVKIPSLFAAPCLPPFTGANGGATYQGVTGTSITVAVPYPQFSAAEQAILTAAGDNDTQAQRNQTDLDYVNYFEHHYQTYGRKVNLVFFQSNVNPSQSTDPAAQNSEAQADAIHVAKEIKAFASLGDAADPTAFHDTLASDHVVCICTTTLPASWYLQRAPYMWGNGLPDETADYSMRAEVICDEVNPFPPQWVGGSTNPETSLKPPVLKHRTYALIWPGDPANSYKPGAQFFEQRLQQECGVTFKDVEEYQLTDVVNAAQAQEDAQTFMSKFAADGVSDVVFVGDPITPVYFTSAATKQQYFPEWIQTGSALTDTATFGRVYDQQQWVHNFGFSALADRLPRDTTDPYHVYEWAFAGKTPPAISEAPIRYALSFPLMTGIMLAGPDLTPETFQCGEPPFTSKTFAGQACVGQTYPGLFGYPVSPTNWRGRVANAVVAWGDHFWSWDYYNQTNDGTLIWWDPNASGPAENGVQGRGLYRYVSNGKRYLYGQFPKGSVPWFDPGNTQTVFTSLPAADRPPTYPYACYYLCSSPGN